MSEPREIAPGVLHWRARRDTIHADVSSYYLTRGRVLLDPMPPAGGFEALAQAHGAPVAVVLTNRHHYRFAGEVVSSFGATVHCHESGLHEFTDGRVVEGFAFGDPLPGGLVAMRLNAICPDETAVWAPVERALAFADGLVREPMDGPLGFVPDHLIGDDPEGVKTALREGFARLATLDPEHLLLAHGDPCVGGGRAALQGMAGAG